jgi:hypothetical protein
MIPDRQPRSVLSLVTFKRSLKFHVVELHSFCSLVINLRIPAKHYLLISSNSRGDHVTGDTSYLVPTLSKI